MRNSPTQMMIEEAAAAKELGHFGPPPTAEQVLAVQAELRRRFEPNKEYVAKAIKDFDNAIAGQPMQYNVGAAIEESCKQCGVKIF